MVTSTTTTLLEEELANYRRRINIATGNVQREPWREGDHDDHLFALCLTGWAWSLFDIEYLTEEEEEAMRDARMTQPAGYAPLTGTPMPPRVS
jgi:hypothetical protein